MTVKKGFTLIELLVVIAIIGILSAVVLTSLNSARTKAKDASIKSELAGVRTAMEIFYDSSNGTYEAGCADAEVMTYRDSIAESAGEASVCGDSLTEYSVSVALPSTGADWCVDSAGFTGLGVATADSVCTQA